MAELERGSITLVPHDEEPLSNEEIAITRRERREAGVEALDRKEDKEEGEGEEGNRKEINVEEEESPSDSTPRFTLFSVHNYVPGDAVHPFLTGLPVVATVTPNMSHAQGRSIRMFRRGPQFVLTLEHGPFTWTVKKYYGEFLSLRRALAPLRVRVRVKLGRRHGHRGYLPHLLSMEDINPHEQRRVRNQLPKVQKFMNAVLNDRSWRVHPSTEKFLEVSRISFVEDLGSKRKEGDVTKRSGGHRRVTNCLGCTACCVCRCSVWRPRWFVLKDSFVVYARADNSVGGVLLFEEGMRVEIGVRSTGIQNGITLTTPSRELLFKAPSHRAMKEWREALQSAMEGIGKEWVEEKRFKSFAPVRDGSTVKWFVDGEYYMAAVADALLAAKDEIFITDWMMNPHVYLKRTACEANSPDWRLDHILLRKADEGVKVFIQLYKEVALAIDLASEYAQEVLSHRNIMVFRHPDHIQSGVYLWAHHEKVVVIDQTLAFVGGIDLCFGRWDNACHRLLDQGRARPHNVSALARAAISALNEAEVVKSVQQDEPDVPLQKWVGKDYYNPFVKDFLDLTQPLEDQLDRATTPRMPWHDVASCVYGPAARDVARHFIQRYNFTKIEQAHRYAIPFLFPRQPFSDRDLRETRYLREIMKSSPTTNAAVQILRSVGEWSAGTVTEKSIHTAYLSAIENAEHYIYIENQFFISSLPDSNVINGIAEALRQRIARAHRENKVFRVFIVMPLLPSFEGEFGERSGAILEAVIHWNYVSVGRGKDSLIGRLIHQDKIPAEEVSRYISVCGLRTHSALDDGKPVSEIVYVHSKCMIVDDRLTIIGSANVNDRSMLGERDSEVAIHVEDREMIETKMNGEEHQVGRFSHTLRCHIFKEHLGLLEVQGKVDPDIDVRDPVCDHFYQDTWMHAANANTEIYEQVFGGEALPTDKVLSYEHLRQYKLNSGLVGEDPSKAKAVLSEVQGVLVAMPLRFLEKENLLPGFGTPEALAPDALVT